MGLELLFDSNGRPYSGVRKWLETVLQSGGSVQLVPVTTVPETQVPDAGPDHDSRWGAATSVDDLADAGMSTVEYAIGTVVAAAFAAVLYRIVTGDSVVAGLTSLVESALNTNF